MIYMICVFTFYIYNNVFGVMRLYYATWWRFIIVPINTCNNAIIDISYFISNVIKKIIISRKKDIILKEKQDIANLLSGGDTTLETAKTLNSWCKIIINYSDIWDILLVKYILLSPINFRYIYKISCCTYFCLYFWD